MTILKYVFGLVLLASIYSLVLTKQIDAKDYFYLVVGVLSAAGLYHAYPRPNSQQAIQTPDVPPAIRQQTVNPQASGAAAAAAQINNGG